MVSNDVIEDAARSTRRNLLTVVLKTPGYSQIKFAF